VAGIDVRGSAPGTRETDLLNPLHLIEEGYKACLAAHSGKLIEGTVAAEVIAQAVIREITLADGLCGIPSVNEVLRF
jgi:L-aminopeptidase/D-esterase-like protein